MLSNDAPVTEGAHDVHDSNNYDAGNIPGPAGKLPQISIEEKKKLFKSYSLKRKFSDTQRQESEPQITKKDDDFDSLPWKNSQSLQGTTRVNQLSSSSLKRVDLVVIIHSIKVYNDQAMVVVKDETGMIDGTLHPQVLSLGHAQIGSVIELENVGLFRPFKTYCHLNITLDSIKSIFRVNSGERFMITSKENQDERIDPELLSEFIIE